MANGFNSVGNVDILKKLTASQTLNVTGSEGKKFIYMKQDGLLYFSGVRPVYTRESYLSGAGWYYDINQAKMFNRGIELLNGKTNDLSDSYWHKDTGVVVTADTFLANAAWDFVQKGITTTGGVLYTLSFYAYVEPGGQLTDYLFGHVDSATGGVTSLTLSYVRKRYSITVLGKTGGGTVFFGFRDGNSSNWSKVYIDTINVTRGSTVQEPVVNNTTEPITTDNVLTPAVFIGECVLDNLGNVYDIRTYERGDVYLSDKWAPIINTNYYFDHPFGHNDVNYYVESIVKDGTDYRYREAFIELAGSKRGCSIYNYPEYIQILSRAILSIATTADVDYSLIARRNF
jgi:hypothetical protein